MNFQSFCALILLITVALAHVSLSNGAQISVEKRRFLRHGGGKRHGRGRRNRPYRGRKCSLVELSEEDTELCKARLETIKEGEAFAECSKALDKLTEDDDDDDDEEFCTSDRESGRRACAKVLLKGLRKAGRKCACIDEVIGKLNYVEFIKCLGI